MTNLQNASISELKQYCQDNDIQVIGDRRKKQSYIDAIENYKQYQEKINKSTVATLFCFPGTFGTIFDPQDIQLCDRKNDEDFVSDKKAQKFWDDFDFNVWLEELSQEYVHHLNCLIPNIENIDTELLFESVKSPKEYNFGNDRIFVYLPDQFLKYCQIFAKNNVIKFAKFIEDSYSSRPGFDSFYSNELEDWLDLESFDHNQAGTFLEFFLQNNEDIDYQNLPYDLYDSISGNSDLFFHSV